MADNQEYAYYQQYGQDEQQHAGVDEDYTGYDDAYTNEATLDHAMDGRQHTQGEELDGLTEQRPSAYDDAGGGGNQDYYDPSQYQNYYYQDEEGNYYYYEDPSGEFAAETLDNAGVEPTPQNLVRSYEYEDWEPQSFGWPVNIIVDTFFSKLFKVYLTLLLYCATVLAAVLGLNYTFAVLFRLYSPPSKTHNPDLQALAYLSLFFYISFVIVSALCTVMDMVRGIWSQERTDTVFWGMSHTFFSKQKPPYVVYLCIILVTVFLPLLWGIVEAAIDQQSLLFVAQRYANVAVLAAIFLVVICYVIFYARALMYKHVAIKKSAVMDDFRLREKAYKHKQHKFNKRHWYHASCVLEEFGVDGKTLRYNCIVFIVGLVPLFALYAAQSLSTYTGTPTVIWPLIGSIVVICLFVIAWLSLLHRKGQWSIYVSFFLIVVLLALGIAGGETYVIGVVVMLFVASQGMLTRKRRHSLTRKELCSALKVPLNREIEQEKARKRVDTYLFCCRDVILDYLRCVDVKTYFGYRHPDVVLVERKQAIKRAALRTDQKALLIWWLIVMLAAAFVIALGNGVRYMFVEPVAVASNTTVFAGANPSSLMCSLRYNSDGVAALRTYDLALLAALSYTWGLNGDVDFATWFSHVPTLLRTYPRHLPPTLNYATDGIAVRFSDFVDVSTDFHFITLNSNSRGLSIFRNMDEWGESITLQVAGAISPLMNIWPERYRKAFVVHAAFLKVWFAKSTALDEVEEYLEELIAEGASDRIVIIGDQFNGGYAKLLSAKYGLQFIAFNPPGVRYKVPFLTNGTQVTSNKGLWSYIDSLEDTANTIYMPCSNTVSANKCGRITTTLEYIRNECGDPHGRTILDT